MHMPIEGHVYILNEDDAKRVLTGLAEVSEMIWEVLAGRKLKMTMDDTGEAELSPPRTYDPPPLENLF